MRAVVRGADGMGDKLDLVFLQDDFLLLHLNVLSLELQLLDYTLVRMVFVQYAHLAEQ
jgi:hypothetical protein